MPRFRSRIWRAFGASLFVGALCVASSALGADPLDWTSWRGPEQNGVSREKGLPTKWALDGENMLWKSEALGGRSSPLVMNGKLYTIVAHMPDSPGQGEKVVCADAETGKILWENKFNVFSSDVPLERVGWGNCVADPETNRIYAMGVCGLFLCIDADTGKTIWQRSLSEQFGLLSTYGGRTNTPVVFEDLVIISAVMINWGPIDPKWSYLNFAPGVGGWGDMAKPAHRFLAMRKDTGEVVWLNGTRLLPDDTTYSTPVVCNLDGQAALVAGSGDGGLYAIQPRTGKFIWKFQISTRGMNTSPLVVGDTIYYSQSEENSSNPSQQGTALAVNGALSGDITKNGAIWFRTNVMDGRAQPMLFGDRLFLFDDSGGLFLFDPKTGDPIGGRGDSPKAVRKLGTIIRSSPVWADGHIYSCEMNGRCWVLKPTAKGVDVASQLRLPEGEEIHGSPAVSHGRIYIPSTEHMYCIGVKEPKISADSIPPAPVESPLEDEKPAHVQVIPADALLAPGSKQKFTARVFNARGQLLKSLEDGEAKFSVEGGGEIDAATGVFTSQSEPKHTSATVKATVGELSGFARARIVPPLPWNFDFTDGIVPISWVGARYRHVCVDVELYDALRKKDARTGRLYVLLLTNFSNAGRGSLKLDAKPPLESWNALLKALGLFGKVKTLADAKKELQAGLDALQKEKVLAKWELTGDEKEGLALSIERGPRSFDGNPVMVKITTIPKGTRSQCWFGPDNLSNYTIQADVRGALRFEKLPDIGLIAQRYTLDLKGEHQKLQIRSWVPEVARRRTETVPFSWKNDVWYTVKFRASVEGDKAVLQGKVWPRDDKEPSAWTITMEDESPNRQGSPGLFGNASDAEIFIDNLSVTPNE